MLEHILNWKLLDGSHDFPGADGGTCINEAAIVAAGFKYRAVTSMDDCPKCFSRPIAQYALCLDDEMPDDVRQLLLPFVMRLSGTADTQQMENKRIALIWIETIRRIFGLLGGKGKRSARLAELCRQCSSVLEVYTTAIQLSEHGWIEDDDAKFVLDEIGALFQPDGKSVHPLDSVFGAANCASKCADSLAACRT
jgi:hypothetical protein